MKTNTRRYWLASILLILSMGAVAAPIPASPGGPKWHVKIADSIVNSEVVSAKNGTFYLTTTQPAASDKPINPTFLWALDNNGEQQWKVPLPQALRGVGQGIFLALSGDEKIIYLVNASNTDANDDVHGSDSIAAFTAIDGKLVSARKLNVTHATGLVVDPVSQNIFISTLLKTTRNSFYQGLFKIVFNRDDSKDHFTGSYETLVSRDILYLGAIFDTHDGFAPANLLSPNGRGGVASIVQTANRTNP